MLEQGVQIKLELEWMMGVELLLFLVGHEVTEGVKANIGNVDPNKPVRLVCLHNLPVARTD
jgi:hypothetical protein